MTYYTPPSRHRKDCRKGDIMYPAWQHGGLDEMREENARLDPNARRKFERRLKDSTLKSWDGIWRKDALK